MIPVAVREAGLPEGLVAIPVRTRMVAPGDDLTALVGGAVRGIARPGDVVAIAETAVAIAQSRFIAAEAIRPSPLALRLSRHAGALATMSQPESLQLVIDQVGTRKVLWAAFAHVAGRLRGRRGVFYEVLGDAIAAIVDANDLRRTKALGASPRLDRAGVERALLGNPHGNGDEQTPLVVLAWRGAGPHPLVTP